MRNLLRAVAVCALSLTSLSTAGAVTIGTCVTRCIGSGFTFVTTTITAATCCSESYNPCPPGKTPVPLSWNGGRC
jgi:hypothetical protein